MSLSQQQLVRIASDIRDRLLTLRRSKQLQVQSRVTSLIEQMNRLVTIRRKLSLCEIRNWQAAGEKVLKQIEAALRDIPYHIQQVEQAVQACNIKVPSVTDVYQELTQADEEFDGLAYHKQDDLLAVTTEPIELNDIHLGEFEIQLHVPSLSEMRYNSIYRIFALDPHPATSNECVTHPHVSDERLCAGDAGAAINMALGAGRICDFFLLVRSVLTNYNPDSPYVSLDNWYGTPCYECGYVARGDDVYWCECCQHEYCGECSSYCRRCDESTCIGCLDNCTVCNEPVCPSCMTTCPECGEQLCKTCLEELQCPCIQENEENQDEESENTTTAVATSDANEERNGGFDVVREAARATESTVGIDAA